MTEKEEGPIPINHAPLSAEKMVAATTKGIFSVSPPGTGSCHPVLVDYSILVFALT